MKLPLQITFRHMERSNILEADIRERAEKLDEFCNQIMACRVRVEAPHQHHQQGGLYRVNIDLTVPGGEIVASHTSDEHHAHEDPYVACRDAFDAVKRRLEDYVNRRRHRVKMHEAPPHGRVAKLVKEEGYGFIDRSDGTQVYFHRNSVLQDAFNTLEVGNEVRFAEETGDEGTQASTVSLIGKHHIIG